MFVYVNDGAVHQTRNHLRFAAQRLDTGQWVMNLDLADTVQREACGWYELTEPDPPVFDPLTQVSSSTIELVDGTPTRVWTIRDKTAEELAAEADAADRDAKAATMAQAVTWLRNRAAEGRAVNVTSTNAVQVLNAVVDNLAVFYDNFADFLEGFRFDGRQ